MGWARMADYWNLRHADEDEIEKGRAGKRGEEKRREQKRREEKRREEWRVKFTRLRERQNRIWLGWGSGLNSAFCSTNAGGRIPINSKIL
jgi:hypothetical protein